MKVADLLDASAALLNDTNLDQFSHANQLPYFKIAYRDLRLELEDYNIPLTTISSAAFTITTAMTDIGGPTGPLLPTDFVEPMELWEITAGTSQSYMLMTRVLTLPKTPVLTAFLQVWSFQNGYIHFLGANNNISVKMDYVGEPLRNVIDENSIILTEYRNAEQFLTFKNAAYCAMFIGENETRAEVLNKLAEDALGKSLGISIKNQQTTGIRRRPFRSGWKQRSSSIY